MLKNLKKALPLGLLISGAIATSAIAGSYTLRVGSGHPSAPTAYVTGMEKVLVPNISKKEWQQKQNTKLELLKLMLVK